MRQLIQKSEVSRDEPWRVSDFCLCLVRGYDRRHRLQRGRKTRTFVRRKDSAIATQIANEASLTSQV